MLAPRLLLIDDDDLSRSVLELHLSADTWDVVTCSSGDDALAHLQAAPDPVAAVLSDLQMPGLCGPALAQALRPLLAPTTPLFAMSGSQPAPERLAGYDAFLLKPFTPGQLRALLDSHTPSSPEPGTPVAEVPATAPPAVAILHEPTFTTLLGYLQPQQQTELLDLCFSELQKHLDRMHRAQAVGDLGTIRHSAHAAKGSFAMIGATELQHLCGELESNCPLAPADQAASLRQIERAAARLAGILSTRGFHLASAPAS